MTTYASVLTVGADPRCEACGGEGRDVERDPDTRMGTIVECDCVQQNAVDAADRLWILGDLIKRAIGVDAFYVAFELAANVVTTE
jgi:hypothetical protein